MARPKRLVLGLGNRLVGDDGFGSAVIEMLRARPGLPANVELVDAHTDVLAHVETLGSYDDVVLVDVVIDGSGSPKSTHEGDPGSPKPNGEGGSGSPKPNGEGGGSPGDVAVVNEETFMRWPETSPSCHQISPLVAVKLFRALQPQATTRITLVALHADVLRVGPGVAASAVVAGAEAVVRLVS
jgi:Ni,Fe-hydrogenase maturation factor